MSEPRTYHEQINIDYTLRLREILKSLPPFAKDFFRAIEPSSSIRTRMNYAYDIRVFFRFLMKTAFQSCRRTSGFPPPPRLYP